MTPALERRLLPALHLSQLSRVWRRLNRRKIVVAMYHGFTSVDAHDGIENHEGKHLHLRDFEAQLAFLKHHYQVIPLDAVVRALTLGTPLPDRAAVITVDDGYRSTYTVAFPALKRLHLPASVYLATDFVENRHFLWTDRVEYAVNHSRRDALEFESGEKTLRLDLGDLDARKAADRRLRSAIKALPQDSRDRAVDDVERAAGCAVTDVAGELPLYDPLSWSDAHEMAESGLVTIGSHTHTHVILSRCEPSRVSEELTTSKRMLESRLGRPCTQFCYPNGRTGDFNAATREQVKTHGFTSALTTVYGMNDRQTDVFAFTRYNLGKPMRKGEVAVRLSGLMDLGSLLRR